MVLHSIQTLHAECQMKNVRTVELRVPQSFSTFENQSFGGLSDVLKKRLGVGLLGSLTTCTFRRLVHVSLGQRMVFVRLINETKPLQCYSWKLPGQLSNATRCVVARCVICLFAARVDLAMQHRRHVVCLFRQQQMRVQFVTQRCTAPRISGTTSSAEMHNVLDPKSTSVNVAGKRAERRGPKTCLRKKNQGRGISWLPVVCSPVLWRSVAWQ